MQKTIEVIATLADKGVIRRYAVAGAVAALNYIQPTLTEDLDILISVDGFEKRKSGLLLLTPIEKALADMGYKERTDVGYMVEEWPVQFLPVSSPLEEEALEQAVDTDMGTFGKARCLRAEHVVAIALKTGRLKDFARIEAFLRQEAVNLNLLKAVLKKHGLTQSWKAYCLKAGITDPLSVK